LSFTITFYEFPGNEAIVT